MSMPLTEAGTRPATDADELSRPVIVVDGRSTQLVGDRLTTVGRSKEADVTLRHGVDMSRKHVGFGFDGWWVWAEQMGTGTSSMHDGVELPRATRRLWLPDGATVSFCGWTVQVGTKDGPPIDPPRLRRLAFAIMSAGPVGSRTEVLDLLQEVHAPVASKTASHHLGELADLLDVPPASRGTGNTADMLHEIRRALARLGRPTDCREARGS